MLPPFHLKNLLALNEKGHIIQAYYTSEEEELCSNSQCERRDEGV